MRTRFALLCLGFLVAASSHAAAGGLATSPRAGSAGATSARKGGKKPRWVRRSVQRFVSAHPYFQGPDGPERVGRILALGESPSGKSVRVFFDTTTEQEGPA